MLHLDDEQFALLTLEGYHILTPESAAHLETCERCRSEIEAYLAVVEALREGVALEQPSEDVWSRIAAELDSEPVELSSRRGRVMHPPDTESAGREPSEAATTATPTPVPATSVGEAQPSAPVVPLRPGRSSESRWVRRLAFAAAASFAAGAASTVVVGQLINRPNAEVIQAIGLDPLPGWSAEGTATLKQSNGDTILVIDLPEPEMDGFREVWLIDSNVERLVSLGTMTGDRAEFILPDGLDLDEYVVVDVSREHFDGDPTHSGDSIVRGVLS
ncbi:MAG: anti-sigma factor domain-containing protein [Actinomycetota bacterium]